MVAAPTGDSSIQVRSGATLQASVRPLQTAKQVSRPTPAQPAAGAARRERASQSQIATAIALIASVAFAFYVANFGSYDKTYGTLGGLVVLLVWMWITNVSLLLGMELNAERERARELAAGDTRADKEIQLEPRAEPKAEKTT